MFDLFIITKIIFLILYYTIKKYRNFLFNTRYSRIVNNNIKFKVIKPKNTLDIINIIKLANKNNFKITTISGGHSYYFLKEFPKFNIDNLIIIDVCLLNKINYVNKNSYINIQAGVLAGDIKKFNNKFKNKYWCLHGDCDSVGLGFWINGGQHSGFNIYSYMSGICGSDCIKTINYVDSLGNYKSISKKDGNLFKAVKMIAGEFGCITSLDINLIKSSRLINKCYVISTDKNTYKPKDTVTGNIQVGSSHGDIGNTEAAILVIDEAVFDLIKGGKKYYDPYSSFYQLAGLDIRNYSTIMKLIGRQKFEKKGANPGGGGSHAAEDRTRGLFKYIGCSLP